jgi:hypothetical protein
MRIIIREPALERYLNHPDGEVGRYLKRKGSVVMRAAKRQVGVRSGALRSSIHMRHFKDSRGQYVQVGSPLPYALMHHQGTKPHIITPNVGKRLAFVKRGALIITDLVRHPGTKPNRYLTDNLRLAVR